MVGWRDFYMDQSRTGSDPQDKTRGGFLEAIDLLKSIEILLRESEEIFYSAGGKQLFRQRAKDAQRLQRQLASQLAEKRVVAEAAAQPSRVGGTIAFRRQSKKSLRILATRSL